MKKRTWALSLVLGGLGSLAPAAIWAQTLPDPRADGLGSRERLDALIERVKLEQDRLSTLEAEFVQFKSSVLLVEPEEAQGVFLYRAPDMVLWEYRSPNPIMVQISGEELTTWYRDLGRAQKMQIRRYSEQVFKYLGATGSLEELMKYFAVQVRFPQAKGERYQVDLTPRYARIAKRLKSMVIWIDPERFIPVKLKYVEPNGDHTEYRFENLRVNAGIPRHRFELHLPPDVEVRRVDMTPTL